MVKSTKAKKSAPKMRNALVVLGMHRSGTSALAGVLHHLGATLPQTLMSPTQENKLGYFESTVVQKFNDALLHEAGSSWKDWHTMPADWGGAAATAKQRVTATALIKSEFPGAPLPLLKDPRICRLAPFWSEALQKARYAPLFLLPFRNPIEVADSLHARDGMPHAVALLVWLRHVLDAEIATRGQPRVFTSFDGLLTDWPSVVARISKTLGVDWPIAPDTAHKEIDAFLSAGLRHVTKSTADLMIDPYLTSWVDGVYKILNHWTGNGERQKDHKALDQINASFNDASKAFGALINTSNQSIKAQAEAQKTLSASQADIASLRTQLEQLTAKLTEMGAQDKKRQIALNEMQQTQQSTETSLVQAEQQKTNIEAKRHAALEIAQATQARYLTLAKLWEEGQSKNKGVNLALVQAQATLKQYEQELATRDDVLSAASEKLNQADAENAELQENAAELQTLRDTLAQTQSELKQRKAESDDTARALHALNQDLTQTKMKCNQLHADSDTRDRELGQLSFLLVEARKSHQVSLDIERTKLSADHDALKAHLNTRITTLDDQLTASKSWAAQLQDRTNVQNRELGQIAKLLSLAEIDRDRHTQTLAEMEVEHHRLRTEMERLAFDAHTLTSSTSWRITAPLRRMIGVFRRG